MHEKKVYDLALMFTCLPLLTWKESCHAAAHYNEEILNTTIIL